MNNTHLCSSTVWFGLQFTGLLDADVAGVESISIEGADKNQREVFGDEVNSNDLTTLLSKHIGYTELVCVTPYKKKIKEKKVEKKPEAQSTIAWAFFYVIHHEVV